MDVTGHFKLARRAAEFMQQKHRDDNTNGSSQDGPFPLVFLVLLLTLVVYYVALIKVRYVIGAVIGTLAIVEESETKVLVAAEYSEDEGLEKKDTDGLLEPEVAVVKVKAVTAKIRTAKAMLRAHGGCGAGFRGFSLVVVHGIIRGVLAGILASFFRGHATAIAMIAAEVLLAKLELVWVHHVISESPAPGKVSWIKRRESFAVPWTKIAPAALLQAVAFQVTIGLPAALYCAYTPVHNIAHGDGFPDISSDHMRQGALLFAGSLTASFALFVLVYVPAHVTFVRVAASLLPEQDLPLVTFDRTFGGRLAAGEKIGLMSAWTTFTWEQRRRYLGLLAKVCAIIVAITVLFAGIAAAEIDLFFGFHHFAKAFGHN